MSVEQVGVVGAQKTIPGRGWFVYLRLYGPTKPAFNGDWRPGDFESVES